MIYVKYEWFIFIIIMNINLNICDIWKSSFLYTNIYFDRGSSPVRRFICMGYSSTSSLSEIEAYSEPS